MALDPYQPCPCGDGKKVKFCCCKDIAADLEKVVRALESEQRAAALDQINRLLAAKGERAGLLALKGEVQIQVGNVEEAKATVDALLAACPESPVALALSSILEADTSAGIVKLQRAMEHLDSEIPFVVYNALSVVGQTLLSSGDVLAARRYLAVQASMAGESDTRAMEMLMQIQSSPQVPLLMKQEMRLAERPADVGWGDKFDEAMKLASRGAWLAGFETLESLSQEVPDESAILKNIAIFRSWLGDNAATVASWRRYGQLKGVPLADAVEAEALAQLLDRDAKSASIDLLTVTYPVEDLAGLQERLLSDKRVSPMPVDLSQLVDEGEPAPNAAFWVLDRPLPASSEGLTREAVPMVLGELYLFGRQTDRSARLEFSTSRNEDYEAKKSALADVVGDLAGPPDGEEVTGEIPHTSAALTWNWRFPDDIQPALHAQLIAEQRRDVMLNKWPETPLPALDGKTPNEAAAGFSYQVKLLAAVLLLDLAGEHQDIPMMDFNELRRKLNLPTRDVIDPNAVPVRSLSLVQLGQLDVEKLGDDDLVDSFQRAAATASISALRRLAAEVASRDESLAGKIDMTNVYEILAGVTKDNEQAFQYIHKARELAVAAGESPARLLLAEMELRLERREPVGCEKIMNEIRDRHIQEPGVAENLYNILVNFGIISPDARPAGPRPEQEAAAVATQAPAQASKLWTPDGDQPEESKSKLWVPGME